MDLLSRVDGTEITNMYTFHRWNLLHFNISIVFFQLSFFTGTFRQMLPTIRSQDRLKKSISINYAFHYNLGKGDFGSSLALHSSHQCWKWIFTEKMHHTWDVLQIKQREMHSSSPHWCEDIHYTEWPPFLVWVLASRAFANVRASKQSCCNYTCEVFIVYKISKSNGVPSTDPWLPIEIVPNLQPYAKTETNKLQLGFENTLCQDKKGGGSKAEYKSRKGKFTANRNMSITNLLLCFVFQIQTPTQRYTDIYQLPEWCTGIV